MKERLEDLIRRYVVLGKKSPKGYEIVKCAKCNDYKLRGGFKFENDNVIYSCFNCSTLTGYDASKYTISKNLKDVLLAFGIPESEIDTAVNLSFFNPTEKTSEQVVKNPKLDLPVNSVELPNNSVSISVDESDWSLVAREYLKLRGLSHVDYPFFICKQDAYEGRIIFPYYFKNKIVYWQARSMDDSIQPRYKNPSIEKDNIIFNMDELYRYSSEPIFVTEGAIDALSIGNNAVALNGSTLSEFKFKELRKVALRRKVIFVMDKNLNGYKLGQHILKDENIEWYVACFPDNYEDANDALLKLGRLWTISHLLSTAVKGIKGKLLLELNCSKT